MSKTKDQILQQLDCESDTMLDITDDIIDTSELNFSDNDTWLERSSRNRAECSVHDLNAWLREDIGKESADSHDNRRSIDTRTFTRPKKRSGRLSFESILEMPTSPVSDVWKSPGSSPNFTAKVEKDDSKQDPIRQRRESTPPMLKPSNPGVGSLCSVDTTMTSGQESLEAFLNMSQSKGIDSFINLGEPEFSDAIMNVSQPSILCTSLMSVAREDLSQAISPLANQTINQPGIEDSQILTESMMQLSMFGDVADVNFNDTFAKNSANVTVLENTSFCSSIERTFIAEPAVITKESLKETFGTRTFNSMDTTYTPSRLNATLTNNLLPNDPYASYTVHNHTDVKRTVNDASFIVRTETASDASFVIRSATPDIVDDAMARLNIPNAGDRNETFDVDDFDATFTNTTPVASPSKTSVNSTFKTSVTSKTSSKVEQNDTFDVSRNFDSTFQKTPVSSPRKSNSTFATAETASRESLITTDENETFNIQNFNATYERSVSVSPRKSMVNTTFATSETARSKSPVEENETFNIQNFNTTYERPVSASPRKSSIHSTFKAPLTEKTSDHAINSTFKAPTKMDTTYQHNTGDHRNDVPVTNRYNTYKKSSAPERTRKENYPTNNLTVTVNENVDTVNRVASLENIDSKFCKPAPKMPSKMNAPRSLSRLPQTLQKSNPNLISNSLKSINTVGRSAIPSFGFNKHGRPSTVRNVEGSLSSKLYGLGKIKSGSEQRLEGTRNAGEFQMTGTGGSTESIESTQSAHSAPDFDDRLSVCSDSSSTSYSMRTMNIDELQKIVRLREDSLKPQSTPDPKRRILENTWVEASKNLPSPILKQGSTYESRGSSPRSMDSTVKTSSPLLSPAESLQNLTINVSEPKVNNVHENKLTVPQVENVGVKKLSEPMVKPAKSSGENKPGLKPPGNWSTANRPASGIPRPASRIPAPRFARPTTKSNQGDIKKGHL